MNWTRAIGAGVLGAAALAAAAAGARWLLGVDFAPWSWAVSAPVLGRRLSSWGEVVLAAGALGAGAALGYALVFEHVTRRAGWRVGALIGVVHGAALAALAGWLAYRSWHSGPALDAAPVGARHGTLALAELAAAGIVFGAIVGACYGAPHHAAEARTGVRWRELYPTTRHFE